jgi:mRNA interferase RelE/StbE
MAWKIEFAESAAKTLGKLDKPVAKRIIKFLKERIGDDPKAVGEALQGNLAPMWRYRVGDYRIICDIVEEAITVIVVKIGHRKEIYK